MNKQTKTLTFAGPVNTTKDNRTFCDFVRQELFSIKSLLLLLTTRISMSGSSLSLPAPARGKKRSTDTRTFQCITLRKFSLLIYQFPETHGEKTTKVNYVGMSQFDFLKTHMKKLQTLTLNVFCVLCLYSLKNGVIVNYHCSNDMRGQLYKDFENQIQFYVYVYANQYSQETRRMKSTRMCQKVKIRQISYTQ